MALQGAKITACMNSFGAFGFNICAIKICRFSYYFFKDDLKEARVAARHPCDPRQVLFYAWPRVRLLLVLLACQGTSCKDEHSMGERTFIQKRPLAPFFVGTFLGSM